jgi:hypothetical protein
MVFFEDVKIQIPQVLIFSDVDPQNVTTSWLTISSPASSDKNANHLGWKRGVSGVYTVLIVLCIEAPHGRVHNAHRVPLGNTILQPTV